MKSQIVLMKEVAASAYHLPEVQRQPDKSVHFGSS
jgi:hypothetical protein